MFKPDKALTATDARTLPRGTTRAYEPSVPGAVIHVPKNLRSAIQWGYRWRDKDGYSRLKLLGPVDILTRAVALEATKKEIAKRRIDPSYDPLRERRETRQALKVGEETRRTLAKAVTEYIAAKRAEWRSEVHADQWSRSLKIYVLPLIGDASVDTIDDAAIRKVLDPIWLTIPETASRVRGRLETILERERVLKHRQGENPARWINHLEHVYAKPSAAKKAKRKATGAGRHFAAIPFVEIPTFMVELRKRQGVTPRALEVCILTAARSSEILGMLWSELDLDTKVWTIPASRMKEENEHRVPLTDRVVEILRDRPRAGPYVFYGRSLTEPLEKSALRGLLRHMGRSDITAHGFRSAWDTWAAETQHVDAELREACLAHGKDKVVAAYQRGHLLDKRRVLMEAWAAFADSYVPSDNVTPLFKAAG
jgi:integrase